MDKIRKLLARAIMELYSVEVEPEVTVAPEEAGADYASNVAFQLAKLVHKAPREIAEEIKLSMSSTTAYPAGALRAALAESYAPQDTSSAAHADTLIDLRTEVAGAGFLNFTLADEYFAEKVAEAATDVARAISGISRGEYAGKTVICEFSDPNPFKVLHVGHLYTSIVGDAMARMLECAGARVVRANFGGDVGLHVAKTLYALTRQLDDNTFSGARSGPLGPSLMSPEKDYHDKLSELMNKLTIEDIAKAYVEGTRAYEEDDAAKAEITQLNKEIYRINTEDQHNGGLAELYWRGRELSYQYFEEFYQSIGVKFDKYYPESSVVKRGLSEVKAHVGSVYEESEGAIVYKGEKIGLHTRVFINREGVPTYETKDVGLLFTKYDDYKFDESVVITGNEQTDYMKVVLASVAEYAPKLVESTTHLTHGLVKLPGNEKMSSRKGNFLKAVDTIAMIREELGGEKADEKIVLGAIKYAFLRYKMGGDIIFDPKESVSTNGNSGVYILYSVVRVKKILKSCDSSPVGSSHDASSHRHGRSCDCALRRAHENQQNSITGLQTVCERSLAKKVVQYSEVLGEAIREKAPNKVCTYLYELAQEFSRFYENVKVVGSEREAELVTILEAYKNVMEHGLGLLGIEAPEEM